MKAGSLRGSIAKLEAELGTILAGFDQSLAAIPTSQWEELMDSAAFQMFVTY